MTVLPLPDKLRKLVRSLHLKKHRDEEKLFLAEGSIIVEELSRSAYKAVFIVVRNDDRESHAALCSTFSMNNIPVYTASAKDFEPMSTTQTPQGILAVVSYDASVPALTQSIIALDGLNDPGNVGTIIRTAHFFGFRTIILGEGCAEKYNPKVVRSTMGSLFHCTVVESELTSVLSDLQSTHDIVGASVHATLPLSECKTKNSICVVIGSESHGISARVGRLLKSSFTIEGLEGAESLNASVAAGISLYHFSRFIHS